MRVRAIAVAAVFVVSQSVSCGSSAPPTITVATWDVDIGEIYKPSYPQRRTMIYDEVPNINADVLCLQGVYRDSDKLGLAAAANGSFPYSAWVPTTLATVASDGLSQPGAQPPCAESTLGSVADSQFTSAFDCLVRFCNTNPGDDSGYVNSEGCASSACGGPEEGVLFLATACYRCGDMTLRDDTFAEASDECDNNPQAGYGYQGNNDLLLLSKLPLSNVQLYTPTSTDQRVGILSATAQTSAGPMDIYCTHLGKIYDEVQEVYIGPLTIYQSPPPAGCDTTTASCWTPCDPLSSSIDCWREEQYTQAKELVQQVAASPHRAIVLAQTESSENFANTSVIANAGSYNFDYLTAKLTPGFAYTYVPACTHATTSLATDLSPPCFWFEWVLLYGISQQAVDSTYLSETTIYQGLQSTAGTPRLLGRGAMITSVIEL